MIAPKVRYLAFEREDGSPLSFKAGQFVTLHIKGSTKTLQRSYSIANVPDQDNMLEMACAYVEGGVATSLLFSLNPGDSVVVSGPYGIFVLKEECPTRYVLVATGTGVIPYRSMLKEIKNRLEKDSPELKIELVFGVRNRSELLFKEEFLQFAKEQPHFAFTACYSKETLVNPEPFERQGYVQAILKNLDLNPNKDIVYLCGNPNMIDDTFALLNEKGFDKQNIRREKYVFSR
jgi:ferredoxin-NADP reductase